MVQVNPELNLTPSVQWSDALPLNYRETCVVNGHIPVQSDLDYPDSLGLE